MTNPKPSNTPTPTPPTSICETIFQQALVYFETGFNAAGYQSMLNGVACLYEHGLLTKRDLTRAIKMFNTLKNEDKEF